MKKNKIKWIKFSIFTIMLFIIGITSGIIANYNDRVGYMLFSLIIFYRVSYEVNFQMTKRSMKRI